MLKETVEFLKPAPGQVFVDATLGGGGHAEALLAAGGQVIAFDQDRDALAAAKARLAGHENIEFIHDNFSNLKKHIKAPVDGILFDLGVSSYQLDESSRGFSLQQAGPLDMRMNKAAQLTAADIVNAYSVDELARLFKEYGEERFAGRISRAICARREKQPIATTLELKEIVEKAIPTWKKRESVTRVFQALRIAVNQELDSLQLALDAAVDLLKPGGRIVVISYHSLEDRIVKHTFRELAKNAILHLLTKKPQLPGEAEAAENPRSRSAKLRAAEKL